VKIETPVTADIVNDLEIGNQLEITGTIYTGRDAALPLLVKAIKEDRLSSVNIHMEGGIIFHTAVSIAGIGPTTSSKVEIEESIAPLSEAGVKIHIGKGSISSETIKALHKFQSVFAVTPPVSALFNRTVVSKKVVAFPEEGIEAIHELTVRNFPAIVAACRGKSIYE
jgi:fumarate hydratase subunit beta